MDGQDLAVLEMLVKDSKASLTEVSKRTGLSRFAVRDRVGKLFNAGVILGPTIVVDPAQVGVSRTAFFEFKTNPHEPWLAKMLEKTFSCDLLDGTVGDFSLLARFRFTSDEHFAAVLKKIDDAMGRSYFKKYRVVNAIKIFKEYGVAFETGATSLQKVDKTDKEILRILLNQVRSAKSPLPLSTVELSRQLDLLGIRISQPAVFNRLSRLEENGAILRHTLRLDHSKLGLQTKFIVRIKANPNAYDAVAESFLTSMSQISDLYRTGEEYGLLATVRVTGTSEFNAFLLMLYDSKEIIDTYSTLVLEERKASPMPLQEE